ncbi:MAG: glycosyl hydrolase family 30 [Sphingobacteriaceae bacterium]|nr:MAG: glycosyl hydrolase family 30 [Sphingobacteriaceae bacterium]
MNKLGIIFFLVILFSFQIAFCQNVKWVSSTDQKRWALNNAVELKILPQDLPCDVEINLDQHLQKIDGWGGCFNELGWDALQILDPAKREEVLKSLFDKNDGLNYTICRMPIGANDYARNWYSLDDTPGDFALNKFNIDRDRSALIPYIKAAMKYQPELKIWGSPWSPPAWMKINNHYACLAAGTNDLSAAKMVNGQTNLFIQKPQYLAAYASYLSKYVTAYRKEGINVFAVAIQNEPYACSPYPTCLWSAAAMGNFIANYVGPTFKKNNTNAEIWFGTINNNRIAAFDTVLADPGVRKFVSAVGVQWAGKNALADINLHYPKLKKIQTESECGNGTFDWNAAEYTFSLMKHYLNNGISTYMYWNMVLDDFGKSTWGWKQNALIVISKEKKQVTYTPEYYLMKHFSNYIIKGAVKLKTNNANEDNLLAFKNPDGKIIVIVANLQNEAKPITVRLGDKYFKADLEGRSFNSFIL